jgi:hypothetical protein
VEGTSLDHLHIYAQDVTWARRLLADPANQATLRRLMDDQGTFGLREIYLQPSRAWLRAHPPSQVTAAHIRQWFDDLLTLAQAAENVQ